MPPRQGSKADPLCLGRVEVGGRGVKVDCLNNLAKGFREGVHKAVEEEGLGKVIKIGRAGSGKESKDKRSKIRQRWINGVGKKAFMK